MAGITSARVASTTLRRYIGMKRSITAVCCYSTEALQTPVPEGQPKIYPTHIENIVKEISQLTLIEVADLNQLLKQRLNIPDAPVMPLGGMMMAAPPKEEEDEEESAPKVVQTSFTLRITSFDQSKKIALIKQIKAVMEGFNLVQAKKFVEDLPAVVKADLSKTEAEELKETLAAAGAECVIE